MTCGTNWTTESSPFPNFWSWRVTFSNLNETFLAQHLIHRPGQRVQVAMFDVVELQQAKGKQGAVQHGSP